MVRNIGGHRERTFLEQVDVLTKRYCGDMLQYRFKHGETRVEGEGEGDEDEDEHEEGEQEDE